jgi:hypothetical protein
MLESENRGFHKYLEMFILDMVALVCFFVAVFENQEGWRHGSTQMSFCERRKLLPWGPPGAFGSKNKVHGCDAEEARKREKK